MRVVHVGFHLPHLLGECSPGTVERILQSADALVQGSHREGSGFAVLEAMACGAVPVVTRIPSFRTMVGEAGLLWSPGDAHSLRRSLLSLQQLDHADRRQRVLERFEQRLCWSAVAARLHTIYRDLLRPAATGTAAPAAAARR